ncbi:UNVERIFIED_CONTAM: hypothetical protein HDU68_004425 [Siphonaria sp. JEL0065]|nr:hypothetical protein HDU68_004425 [Siphonaria sp. JEL0065]
MEMDYAQQFQTLIARTNVRMPSPKAEDLFDLQNEVTCIGNLKLGVFAGVFAVVRDDNSQGKSRKGDYMLTMTLMDPTASFTFGVSMFAKTKEGVPESVKAGQIIKLTPLKIQQFNGRLQGLSTYQTKVQHFHMDEDARNLAQDDDRDLQIARFLYQWNTRLNMDPVDQSRKSALFSSKRKVYTISRLKETKECFDLFCQVMQVLQYPDGMGSMVILVSDFTKASFQNGATIRDDEECPLLYPVARDVLRVTLWDTNDVENSVGRSSSEYQLNQIERGSYLFLRNLFTKEGQDSEGRPILEASLHTERVEKSMGGRWQLLGLDNLEVVKLRRRAEEQNIQINRSSSTLTKTPAYIQLSPTIKDILESSHNVPSRFKFVAMVVDHLPTHLENFTRLICDYCGHSYTEDKQMCSSCGNGDTGQMQYMFSLLLGDDIGFLPVIFTGEEAEKFLRFEARDLTRDAESLKRLHSALSALFTVGGEGQPRVTQARKATFCVQSFQPEGSASVQYKLIATELIW